MPTDSIEVGVGVPYYLWLLKTSSSKLLRINNFHIGERKDPEDNVDTDNIGVSKELLALCRMKQRECNVKTQILSYN